MCFLLYIQWNLYKQGHNYTLYVAATALKGLLGSQQMYINSLTRGQYYLYSQYSHGHTSEGEKWHCSDSNLH